MRRRIHVNANNGSAVRRRSWIPWVCTCTYHPSINLSFFFQFPASPSRSRLFLALYFIVTYYHVRMQCHDPNAPQIPLPNLASSSHFNESRPTTPQRAPSSSSSAPSYVTSASRQPRHDPYFNPHPSAHCRTYNPSTAGIPPSCGQSRLRRSVRRVGRRIKDTVRSAFGRRTGSENDVEGYGRSRRRGQLDVRFCHSASLSCVFNFRLLIERPRDVHHDSECTYRVTRDVRILRGLPRTTQSGGREWEELRGTYHNRSIRATRLLD